MNGSFSRRRYGLWNGRSSHAVSRRSLKLHGGVREEVTLSNQSCSRAERWNTGFCPLTRNVGAVSDFAHPYPPFPPSLLPHFFFPHVIDVYHAVYRPYKQTDTERAWWCMLGLQCDLSDTRNDIHTGDHLLGRP